MDKWTGKVAVVTGASSGIGAAIVRSLVRNGLIVVGLARRVERIQELAKELTEAGATGQLYSRKVNLRKEEEILEAFAWIDKDLGGTDILVNNAGIFYTSDLKDGETDRWRALFDVNVIALSICTREYLKSMDQRNNQVGHIININSIAGHMIEIPQLNMYSATKHAVKAITMSLRRELAEKKSMIKVTSVSPGPVATEIWQGTAWEGYEVKITTLSSEDVAQVVVDALSASPTSQICEVIMTPIPTEVGVI